MNQVFRVRSGLLAITVLIPFFPEMGATAQPPPALYQNDFATRSSAGVIGAGTFSLNYTNGSLINADAYNPYANQNMQDGWVKGKNGGLANLLVKTTNGNACACICATSEGYTYAMQPIMNALSGGVVRVSCDMRPPRQWSAVSRNMAFYVGQDAFMTEAKEEFYKYCGPMAAIASQNGTETDFKFRCHNGFGNGTHEAIYGTAAVDTTHWYRFVLDLTLSGNTYTAAIYDMGTDQPTLATATPGTAVETFGGRSFGFRMNLTPALGGITTLGLSGHGVSGGESGEIDIDLTARFDNVTIAFKAEGGTAFTGIYANDFATRTYTRLGPGSKSYTYAVSGIEGDTLSYWQGNLVPKDVMLEFPNGANGPLGQDGWARRNNGLANIMVTNPANPYVRFHTDNGDQYGYAVQRIGSRLTNGTARFSVDMRPPNAWYWFVVTKGMLVNVGDNAFYNGEIYNPDPTANSFNNHYATRFGFNGATSSSDFRFVLFDGDGANSATQVWGTAAVDTARWYRFVADLDLTNSTVALNIYDMGTTQPAMTTAPGTLVQTFSGGFRRKIGTGSTNLDGGVTSFGLTAFGPRGGADGTNTAETALFDNVRVEARPAGYPAPTLICANDFSSRTFTNLNEYAVARLTGNIDMLTGGQDDWMLRNNGTLPVRLSTQGGNPHYRASSTAANHSYSIQPLGTRVTGNILCCQADMRPPRYWNDGYHSIGVYLGDDEFWQGNRGALRWFGTRFAVQFGFGSASTGPSWEAGTYGVYPDVSFLATDGTGAGAWTNKLIGGVVYTNWYRFKAEADLAANTYQVKVYNMGTAQPTLQTPTPSQPVAVFENNRFTTDMRRAGDPDTKLNGISALGLAAFGVRGGGLYPANETALVDNLQVSVKPKGTLIRVF